MVNFSLQKYKEVWTCIVSERPNEPLRAHELRLKLIHGSSPNYKWPGCKPIKVVTDASVDQVTFLRCRQAAVLVD